MPQRTHRRLRRGATLATLATALLAAAVPLACGDDETGDTGTDDAGGPPTAPTTPATAAAPTTAAPSTPSAPDSSTSTTAIDDERCEANRDAGTVTFLTGFDFAAAASIVEVITAEANGYYDELCLDVDIVSSFSTANYPLVAGGQGQFASGGSFSEVVAFARNNDADLVAVTVAGRTPIDTLVLKPDAVGDEPVDPTALAGTTIGVKGALPASVEVMLRRAGLTEGADYETVPVDGFDPEAHFAIPSIVGVPGWKSNEPGRLERAGVDFVTLDPSDAGVPGSFGAIFTTRGFVEEHPTAATDFVRATLRGLATAIDDPGAASAAALALVEASGNPNFLSPEGETFRWETEAELIAASTPPGVAAGTPDPESLAAEVEAYAEVDFFGGGETPDVSRYVDAGLAAGVTGDDGQVLWPG